MMKSIIRSILRFLFEVGFTLSLALGISIVILFLGGHELSPYVYDWIILLGVTVLLYFLSKP